MNAIPDHAALGGWVAPAAHAAVIATLVSAAALVLLHAWSPELAPSWRMVSEYANGRVPWLLTVVFAAWAISSLALAVALWPLSSTTLGKAGLLFLVLAAVGQSMGALFDINHRLHGPAAMVGIPSLCLAAVLLRSAMARHPGIDAPPVWSAHLPWISFALMLGTVVLFFSALTAAGVDMSGRTKPLQELPPGVVGHIGWANRLLFAASYIWVMLASLSILRTHAG